MSNLNPYVTKDYSPLTQGVTGSLDFRKTNSTQSISNVFVATATYNLGLINLLVKKIGTPTGQIFAQVFQDNGGGILILKGTSDVFDVSALPSTWDVPVDFTFTNSVSITSGTTYRIVLVSTINISTSNYLSVGCDLGSTHAYSFDGTNWISQTNLTVCFVAKGLRCLVRINLDTNIISNLTAWYNLIYSNTFDTSSAVIVHDINNIQQTGFISTNINSDNELIFEYDYYNNTQSGLSAGIDKSIVLLVEGVSLDPSKTIFTIRPGINEVTLSSTPIQYFNRSSLFIFNQPIASSIWVITHNLNTYPTIIVIDSSGNICYGDMQYNSINQLTITFSAGFSGTAYLR